jgi:hypothetical protein
MTIPLIQRCCLCSYLKEIVDTDTKPVHGGQINLYYCGDCLKSDEPLEIPTDKPKRKSRLRLSADPQALVLGVLESGGLRDKYDILAAVIEGGDQISFNAVGVALRALVRTGQIQECRDKFRKLYSAQIHAMQKRA